MCVDRHCLPYNLLPCRLAPSPGCAVFRVPWVAPLWVIDPLRRNLQIQIQILRYRFHGWWRRTLGCPERRRARQPQRAPPGASCARMRVRIWRVFSGLCTRTWWACWIHCLHGWTPCRQWRQALIIPSGCWERHRSRAWTWASNSWICAAACAQRSIRAAATAAGAAATAQPTTMWCSIWWSSLCS